MCYILKVTQPYYWASLVSQRVKNLPAMQETRVQSLGPEDPLEKEMDQFTFFVVENIVEPVS